ncbi:MAG TPA: histidine-type phosphatase [Acidobacteriaceae bacterium]|nr:histidine-type phosphatase [Acidobacteriaceae bacterium]
MKTLLLLLAGLLALAPASRAQQPASTAGWQLRFVVYLSRHGVRSPTGKASQLDQYSIAPWPKWSVAPGYLTPHGYQLMQLFGAYDRSLLASEGLFAPTGCDDARRITIYADSDQRTRETGKALAAGLFPGCNLPVGSLPEGTQDPLFHPARSASPQATALAAAAISGRVGGDPKNLTLAYHAQLAQLDDILSRCGTPPAQDPPRVSLFNISAALNSGMGDHAAELRGPLSTAATLSEDILLEYTDGMPEKDVAWGCVNGDSLRSLINLHTASFDFAQRTPAVARMQASNLLDRIDRAIRQAASGRPVPGAPDKPSDRALFLVGHDTNIANIAGLLHLTWIADGRRDDTAPGSALVFELWQNKATGAYSVRAYLTVQTLEQMRTAATLDTANPPARVPLFLPACGAADGSCPLDAFSRTLRTALDPAAVTSPAKP